MLSKEEKSRLLTGCGDGGCQVRDKNSAGMVTNGGCRCVGSFIDLLEYGEINFADAKIALTQMISRKYKQQ